MIRLQIIDTLSAELGEDFVWSCEDTGYEEFLNRETKAFLQERLSPSLGLPRIAVMNAMAAIVDAYSIDTDEDDSQSRDVVY